jgi:hypothetical protein
VHFWPVESHDVSLYSWPCLSSLRGSGWLAVFSLAIGRPLVASSNCMPAAALSVTCCTRCALFALVGRPWLAFLLQAVVFSIGCATVVNEKHNTLNGGKNIWQANQSSHTD